MRYFVLYRSFSSSESIDISAAEGSSSPSKIVKVEHHERHHTIGNQYSLESIHLFNKMKFFKGNLP